MSKKLNVWTVYKNTKDFPGQYVSRRFELDKPTRDHFANNDKNKVIEWIFSQAAKCGQGDPYCLPRQHQDDPVIVETWV
jgi:hypothetical protein